MLGAGEDTGERCKVKNFAEHDRLIFGSLDSAVTLEGFEMNMKKTMYGSKKVCRECIDQSEGIDFWIQL